MNKQINSIENFTEKERNELLIITWKNLTMSSYSKWKMKDAVLKYCKLNYSIYTMFWEK